MKNNKSIYIVGVFMLITMLSIGYAIVSGVLNINGTAKINAAKWDIYFKNIKIKDGSVTATVKPAISNKTTVNFEVELKKPGDFYEFNVDVVNDGMIDAMIESINIEPELTTDQQKYLNYSVTYADGVIIEEKDILHANKSRTLKVKVEYKKNISNNELLSNEETINVHVEIKYVQADNTAKESTSIEGEIFDTITLVSGDGTNLGDEIAIGDEHFYVIKNDGENISMLAKYNLLVGNVCENDSSCTPIANPTGIQDESAKGRGYQSPVVGTVPFSSVETTYDQSSVKQYVDEYKDYLEGLGAEIIEARLMSGEELGILGCSVSAGRCSYSSYSPSPSWATSTRYWTSSNVFNHGVIGNTYSNGASHNTYYLYAWFNGVRPVIVIPASSI